MMPRGKNLFVGSSASRTARSRCGQTAGFSLIEMIGVMAVMAILASTIAPNVVRSLDRAAVRAEEETLRALGEQAKLYLRDSTTPPSNGAWDAQLATYASLSPFDVLNNRRQMQRVFVNDPTAANQRALLLSSMHNGTALPSVATIQNNFAGIWNWVWNTATNPRPPGFAAATWTADKIPYLVIERINFAPVYRTDLQAFTVTLRNRNAAGGAAVSYRLTRANGTSPGTINIPANSSVALAPLYTKDQIALFRAAGGATFDFTYVVSTTGRTLEYHAGAWLIQ
jgi:prepilin-type N-terminal cleavage/methylation domain-containing protein